MTNRKVMLIVLDGATFDILMPWIEDGKLPNFKELVERGSYGNLISTLPPFSPVAYASLLTGKNPGKHGIFGFLKRRNNRFSLITSDDIRTKTIYDILSEEGKRIIAINLPLDYPPRKINGIMISGFLAPKQSIFTYPENLTYQLRKKGYEIESVEERFVRGKEKQFLKRLYYVLEKRAEIALELMKKEKWDFFLIVFTGTVRIQYYFWRYMERGDKRYGNEILKYYQKIDQILGKFIREIDATTTLIIISDHGFGRSKGNVYLNYWFLKKGLLKFKSSLVSLRMKLGLTQHNILALSDKIPGLSFLTLLFYRIFSKIWLLRKALPYIFYNDIDFSRTKAYAGEYGGIYLNSDNNSLRNEIMKELKKIKGLNGENVFKNVYRKEELYSGPYLKDAPDILVESEEYNPLGSFGFNKLISRDTVISGTHRRKGILILWGGNIKKTIIKDAEIVDVTPTILKLMGVQIPEDMDGKPLV